MLFEDKYFCEEDGTIINDYLLYCRRPETCCICGKPTHFLEINYQAYLCSEECENKLDYEFSQGNKIKFH